MNMLATMKQNSVIFPSGDHNTFPLIYLLRVKGYRPDITLADKYGYVEPAIVPPRIAEQVTVKGQVNKEAAEQDEATLSKLSDIQVSALGIKTERKDYAKKFGTYSLMVHQPFNIAIS